MTRAMLRSVQSSLSSGVLALVIDGDWGFESDLKEKTFDEGSLDT